MQITRENIEVHETPTNLYGYHGDIREQRANVIIRRNFVGSASNDLGFNIDKNGNCDAYISEFDVGEGYNQKWTNKLKQRYSATVATKAAVKKGYRVTETSENGKIKIRCSRPTFEE